MLWRSERWWMLGGVSYFAGSFSVAWRVGWHGMASARGVWAFGGSVRGYGRGFVCRISSGFVSGC